MSRLIPLILTLIVFAVAPNLSAQSSTLQPLNRPGTPIPASFEIGERNNTRLCNGAEGGSLEKLKNIMKQEGVELKSIIFWSIKCEQDPTTLTDDPNLLQQAILASNFGLVKSIMFELSTLDTNRLNIILINENGALESILDWLNRQIDVKEINMANKEEFEEIRDILTDPSEPYHAKTIEQLRAQQ